jgi:hypothetical protein
MGNMSELENMTQDERAKRYFESARSYKTNDRLKSPTNALTAQIIRWFHSAGGTARRVNVQGTFDNKKGKWRPSGMRRGFEDVDGTFPLVINGVTIGIKIACEVKLGKDVMSEDQLIRKEELEAAGGIYIVSKTIDQTINDIYEKIFDIKKRIVEPK